MSLVQLFDEALYDVLGFRAVGPKHQLECLDVLTRVEKSWLEVFTSCIFDTSSGLTPVVKQGSMLSEDLMATSSNWQPDDIEHKRKGLADLRNCLIVRPSDANVFKKNKKPRVPDLTWKTSKGLTVWLMGVAGIDLGKDKTVSCTMESLTVASVEYPKIRSWVSAGDWRPNASTLQLCSAEWSEENRCMMKSLWIVTEILYANKLTVKGQSGLVNGVSTSLVPGLSSASGAAISVKYIEDSGVELRAAKRNDYFAVGYRTVRLDYNLDGMVLKKVRAPEDGGLRGDDDDPHQANLKLMKEDIFGVDKDGDKVPIPLLTPTKEELIALRSLLAKTSDPEGSSST